LWSWASKAGQLMGAEKEITRFINNVLIL